MKKQLMPLVLATALFACSTPAENKSTLTEVTTAASSCVKEGPEVDLMKKAITAYSTGDWATMQSCFADTAVSYHNADTVPMKMTDRIELFKKQRATIDGGVDVGTPNLEVVTVNSDDEKYNGYKWGHAWVKFTSTPKGGVKKSTQTFASFAIKDGKIIWEQVIYDTK